MMKVRRSSAASGRAVTRVAAALAILGAMMVGLAGSAGAAGSGTVTISPNPIPFTSNQTSATVQVSWTGQKPNKLIFIDICRKSITDPTFDYGLDCSLLSDVTPNGTATGAGTKAYNVFRGENPDGDTGWGCFAPGDPAIAGVDKLTKCYVRVTNDSNSNSNDAVEAAYTLSVGGDTVPEAPLGVIIPIIGAVVVAGAFFLLRRRATAAS